MRGFAFATAAVVVAVASAPLHTSAASWQRRDAFDIGQRVFGGDSLDVPEPFLAREHPPNHPEWEPLEHSSGISPYHDAPGADIRPPTGCQVSAAAFLIRHTCIHANDEEWEEFMEPFVERIYANRGAFPPKGPLGFLNEWKSNITAENAESVTDFGKEDAHRFGKRFRSLYPHLFPPKKLGKGKKPDNDSMRAPFKVWSASSNRDIDTAKAFVQGAFPKHQEGRRGEGDGNHISLVEVPNKDHDWAASLTPHKICPRFTKDDGKADARVFLSHWGPGPLQKLRALAPNFDFQLEDVVAIFMLCGYESVNGGLGTSGFCSPDIYDAEDWKNFEYFFDVNYHKMVGYGSPIAAQLGIHWVNTSTHNLMAVFDEGGDHGHMRSSARKDPSLPDPGGPPNATHSQRLFAYFTHREEPGVALTALGLWNQTKVGPMPLDRRVDDRVWKTSHVLPFLGHVALERLECVNVDSSAIKKHKKQPAESYIRAIVNGAAQPLDDCRSGPGKTCPLADFGAYVEERMARYGDFAAACRIEDDNES